MQIYLLRALIAFTCIFGASAQSSFVIEAEDINFDGGQYVPSVNTMPYYGGAYDSLGAVHNVDYFRPADIFEGDVYRYSESQSAADERSQSPRHRAR